LRCSILAQRHSPGQCRRDNHIHPAANFTGSVNFDYRITDSNGGDTAFATVSVTVNAVNDAPVAADDISETQEDQPVTVYVLSNDSDPEADMFSITGITKPTYGTAVLSAGLDAIVYTPFENYYGADSFSYTISETPTPKRKLPPKCR
jgi:hypothetical protein